MARDTTPTTFRPLAVLHAGLRDMTEITGRSMNAEIELACAIHYARFTRDYARAYPDDPHAVEAAAAAGRDYERMTGRTYGRTTPADFLASYAEAAASTN